MSRYDIEENANAQDVPQRVALIRRETSASVLRQGEEILTSAPNLLIRELALFQLVVGFFALLALLFDAPLEGIADPLNTPNPAKAPWYFLGLQELLAYFPPVVAGVVLPGLVVLAIVAIPYFRVNWEVSGFLKGPNTKNLTILSFVVIVGSAILLRFHAWPVAACTLLIYLLILFPLTPLCPAKLKTKLLAVPLADWIMTWFVLSATFLTVIGVYFRGPGWGWVWPWQGGGH